MPEYEEWIFRHRLNGASEVSSSDEKTDKLPRFKSASALIAVMDRENFDRGKSDYLIWVFERERLKNLSSGELKKIEPTKGELASMAFFLGEKYEVFVFCEDFKLVYSIDTDTKEVDLVMETEGKVVEVEDIDYTDLTVLSELTRSRETIIERQDQSPSKTLLARVGNWSKRFFGK